MSKSTPSSVSRSRFVPLTIVTIVSVLCLALIFTLSSTAAGVLIAGWSFEGVTTTNTGQTPTVSVGSATADSGALTAGSAFTGFHTSTATVWSNPVGNGSPKSVSTNNWGVGDYYRFSFSTTGYSAISITWDQTGSATGPRDFKVQYSTNGSTFTDATGANSTYSLIVSSWTGSGGPNPSFTRTLDLSSVSALANQSTVFIRLVDNSTTAINGTTVAAAGTGRVDNFTVSGTATGSSTNPTGTGAANPSSVAAGGQSLLTVTVTPGTNPGSTGIAVTANLTAIGGSNNQAFLDDGLNGDAVAGDNIFSFNSTVSNPTTSGAKTLPFTVSDAQLRSSSGNISLTVTGASTNPTGTGNANPSSVLPGASTLLTVNVTPGTNPASTSLAVTADLSSIGGSATQAFSGSGNTFTFTATVSNGTTAGSKTLPFTITDAQSRSGSGSISLTVQTPPPPPNDVVISQIYGGGGNTGSTLKNDYIELINHSSAPVNLNGWSVQAYVNNDTTNVHEWQMTPLTNFTLQPGQYYLIQESQGAGGTDNLPTPDAIGTITVSSASTKVALVNNTTLITAACPASGVIDLVGYGTDPIVGTCHEGSGAAPELSNTIAIQRRNEGCYDTDDNAADFVIIAPTPHNTSSAVHDCTGLSAFGSANPSTIVQGGSTTLSVRVAPAQNPSSTGLSVTADLTSIGGSASQAFAAGSGNVFTYTALVPANNAPGMKSLPVTVTDAASRTANTNILLSILPIIADHVTISQIYGGGGNTNATYTNDYVELYNPTAATVSLAGWSLQYGPATNTTAFTGKTVIGGSIAPGAHYLISLASGGATGAQLPQPSVSGDINISATTGKIALVSNVDTLIGACPLGTDPDIVDFVGYGTTANCHEGNANAPAPSNTTAIFRKSNVGPPTGDTDTDQNGNDFVTGAPNPRSESPAAEFGPSVAGTDPASNATTAPYDSSITVVFSEPVTVDSGWYNITCTVTGVHSSATEAHTGDLKTYAVTPNVSFQFGEQCTVTIPKTAVHDVDTDDGAPDTDTLAADYVWSFTVVGAGQPAPYPPSVHLTLGNPSGADAFQPLNYLMEKPTYALSYNRDKGTPNWVSWHLDSSWYGTLARVDVFRPDPKVDPTWYRVQDFDYTNSGFDRGHMTPNADRDNQNRVPINQETYLMSNIIPQAPDNNQGPWAALEAYLRTQSDAGNELYIVSGPNGVGGTGSNGSATTIANGHVTVPASTWKVALILPAAIGDDVARVTCSTRTIAVLMPNVQGIRNNDWHTYLTTIDNIEQLTGYDFFSNLPPAVQACIEAGTDGTNPPGTANQTASTTEDNSVTVTLQALQSNANPLTFSITSSPTSGSLGSVSAATCSSGTCTATVTYTPTADFNGSDSFTFRANDGSVHSNTSTVTVGVSEVNDAPTATDDSKSTPEDTPLSFPSTDLTGNDSAGPTNESTQVLTVTSVTGGANTHGSVGLASGTVTYTPDANYNGAASFTYNVCDNGTTNGSLDTKCTTATVNVDVQSVNDNPTPVDDSATTDEDTPVTIAVLTNDSDVDGDSLTINAVTQGAHGSVTNNGNNVTYSPAANFNGSDSFSYTVSDGHGGTATANVSVTINAVNDAPVANNDSATTDEDTPATINVLGNDSDVDGDTLTVSAVTQGAHGSVTNNGGNVTYSPAANYNGNDSFSYTISDGHGGTATATVEVTINAVNDAPVANNDSATTNEDTSVIIAVLGNDSDVDGDSLSVSAVTQGAHGSVTNNGSNVTYSPAANYNGGDSFSYTVSDGHGGTATATVSVTINAVNDNPVAVADSATTNEDNPVTIDVVANDTDVDGDSLSLTSVGSAAHGSVSIVSGKAVYSPAANYNGNDSFGYVVSDGHGGQANGVVSVTVNPVNDAPTANGQSVNTPSNTPVAITLTGSDTETPSSSLTFTVTSGPSHGSLTGTGANRIYTPGPNYSGPDSFRFTVTDTGDGASGPLTSSEATISITVNDTVPPVITLNGNVISLWPLNKSMHTINVSDLVAGASDNFDPNVNLNSVVIASVSSDEGTAASGDVAIAGDCKSVQLKATRDGNGDGRVYTITFRARDAAGNTSFVTAKVTVPHDQGHGDAIDSGAAYTINSSCP